MEQIYDYILNLFVGEGIAVAVGAYVLGRLIKTVDFIPNKYIPLICSILGASAGVLIPNIFPDKDLFISAIQGMALAWAATGGYETIRNLTEKKENGS